MDYEHNKYIEMDTPSPGTPEAINSGCTCPVLDNRRGFGYMGIKGVFIYSGNCPIHKPTEPTETNQCKSNPDTN